MPNLTNLSNASVVDTAVSGVSLAREFVPLVFMRLWDLAMAPFREPEMLWIIFPLLLTLIVLEFYFDRHGDDELGWAAAVANSLILFIVAMDLIRHSFPGETPWQVFKDLGVAAFTDATLPLEPQVLLLILFIGALGVGITVVNYYHLLPRKLAFEISGHPPVNFLAYFAIAIVYSSGKGHPIPLDLATLLGGVVLYLLLLLAVFSVKRAFRRLIAGSAGRSVFS